MTTEEKLKILRHALGLRPDGTGASYRAHYCAHPNSSYWQNLMAMVADGLVRHESLDAEMVGFFVTEAGREFVEDHSPSARRAAILDRIGNLDDETLFTLAECLLEVE